MATKKPMIDEPFGKAVETGPAPTTHLPSEPVPTAIPVVAAVEPRTQPALTTTAYHELNEDEARRVATIKEKTGDLVSYLKTLRDSFHDAEVQRALAIAITDVETASMWATRAVTWRG